LTAWLAATIFAAASCSLMFSFWETPDRVRHGPVVQLGLQLIHPPPPGTGRRARLHLGAAHHQGDGRILLAGHRLHGRGGHRGKRVVLTGVFALQRPGQLAHHRAEGTSDRRVAHGIDYRSVSRLWPVRE